jgi:hypothetical protein
MPAAYSAASAALLEPDTLTDPLMDRPPLLLPLGRAPRGDADSLLLRNVGGKPLRLRAELLAEGSNRAPEAACWHEVAVYRTDVGQTAVALRFMRPGGAENGVHRARVFEDMDAAATWLEGFDPAADLSADFDVSDTRISTARIALKAAALRDRAERLDRAYRGLIGEVLFRLESEL